MRLFKTTNFYLRSSIFTILSLAGSALGFALYPALARTLSTQDFGDFASIVALSNQAVSFLAAFNVISLFIVKRYSAQEANANAQAIQKILMRCFLVLAGLLIILSPVLKQVLNIQSGLSFVVLGLILLIAVPISIWVGYLQGHKELVRVGMYSLCAAFLKLALTVALAYVYGVNGGLFGFVGGGALAMLALWFIPGRRPPSIRGAFRKLLPAELAFVRSILPHIAASIFIVGSIGLLQNFDLTLAKALFNPDTAGVYSGVGFLSNALYFVLMLIIWIILPEVDSKNPHNNRRVLGTALKLFGLIIGGTIVGEYLLRDFLTSFFLGTSFSGQGMVLIYASLYQASLALLALYCFYLLMLNDRRGVWLCGLVLLSCAILPATSASNPLQMIVMLWLCVLFSGIIYWLITSIENLKHAKN